MHSLSRALAVTTFTAALTAPAIASAQGAASVEGFGGLGLGVSTVTQSQSPSLGGRLTFEVTPGIQVIGEAGRIGNVLPPLADAVFSLAQTDLRASAFYGEGGFRFLAAPHSKVSPYGEATAGIARLSVSSPKLGTIGNAAASIALTLAGRTEPVAGLGGGLLVRTGPVVFDFGYRYKQLFTDDVLRVALGFGEPLRTHQVRAGIGVRF